jgi:histidine ammonia-lyase
MSAALMGHGRIDLRGEIMPAAAALQKLEMEPLSSAQGRAGADQRHPGLDGDRARRLFTGERVFGAAIAAGALSVDALKGSVKPFDPRISELRGQPGQIRVAAALRGLLDGSEIVASHARCGRSRTPTASAASRR